MYWAICVQVTARMPPSIEQSRMPSKADEHRDLELHAEEARGDDAGAEDLRRHVREGAGHQHDHRQDMRAKLPPKRNAMKSGTV